MKDDSEERPSSVICKPNANDDDTFEECLCGADHARDEKYPFQPCYQYMTVDYAVDMLGIEEAGP